MNTNWLSAHIYYSDQSEIILTNVVKPFIHEQLNENNIECYFFIRYWAQGPHIRLRLKGNPKIVNNHVKPVLESYISEFMKEFPSIREEYPSINSLPESQQWLPNNSLQFIPYIPEIKRYGGQHTISLAEMHFQHSSDTVLKLITSDSSWNYERALGAAIQLHLSFAHATGMNTKEAYSFFNYVFESWFPRAVNSVVALKNETQKEREARVLEAFEKTLEKQENILLPFIHDTWEMLENGNKFRKEDLNNWLTSVKKIDDMFKLKQKQGKFTPPFELNIKSIRKEMVDRWSVYQSFIHMTNNRLKILNWDEGFLGFILKKSMKHAKHKAQ